MRLFFGLSLPDFVRSAVHACALEAQKAVPGRYVPAENYHITLAFLGDVPPERLEEAKDALARCASAFPAPALRLDGLSHFGRAQNGILIVKAASEPALAPLHDALVHGLHTAGLPADPGPFSPHITLARHAVIPQRLPSCPPLSFDCALAHVFLSARDEQGILRYTPLSAHPFSIPERRI